MPAAGGRARLVPCEAHYPKRTPRAAVAPPTAPVPAPVNNSLKTQDSALMAARIHFRPSETRSITARNGRYAHSCGREAEQSVRCIRRAVWAPAPPMTETSIDTSQTAWPVSSYGHYRKSISTGGRAAVGPPSSLGTASLVYWRIETTAPATAGPRVCTATPAWAGTMHRVARASRCFSLQTLPADV